MKKKLMASILAASMLVSMAAGCGNTDEQTDAPAAEASGTTADAAAESGAADTDGEEVTIKLFSNLPDRKNGQGLVEQTIIDQYMSENPNVNIEVEALDEESYKTKFKAYAMDGMPDVVSIWGQPSFLDEVLDAGVLAELDESDYSDYGFVSGSLEGFKKDGKLYGLPRNTDIMVFYYNEKMFDDNGWEVPQTYDDLLALSDQINAAGIVPVAMDGGDGWVLACYMQEQSLMRLQTAISLIHCSRRRHSFWQTPLRQEYSRPVLIPRITEQRRTCLPTVRQRCSTWEAGRLRWRSMRTFRKR